MSDIKVIRCLCHSSDHVIMIERMGEYPEDPDYEDILLSIHLCKLPFWKRLKKGIGYIFGKSSTYGHFDEILIDKKELITKINSL